MDINQLYQTTLGRDPSAEAATFWQQQFAQDPLQAQNAFNAAALQEISSRNPVDTNTNNTNNTTNTTNTFDMNSIIDPINSGFSTLTTGMNDGFDTVGQNLNTLNTNVGDGFSNIGQGLNQLNTNNQAAFDNMSANFAAAADARTAMQTALLNGQTNLSDHATGIQNNLNTYFQSLTDGQNNMTGRLGALQTGQDDFREAFDRQSTIQNRTAGDLADSVSGGFNSVNSRLGGMQAQGAGQAAAMNVAPNASGFSPLAAANTQAQDFTQAAVALAQGTTSPQADPTASRFVQAVNTMRQMSQNPQLNPAIRSAFADVSSSFDPNGRLVPNMTLPDGSRMARAIANGALNVRQFDAMGNTTRAQQYDLNQMIGMLQG